MAKNRIFRKCTAKNILERLHHHLSKFDCFPEFKANFFLRLHGFVYYLETIGGS